MSAMGYIQKSCRRYEALSVARGQSPTESFWVLGIGALAVGQCQTGCFINMSAALGSGVFAGAMLAACVAIVVCSIKVTRLSLRDFGFAMLARAGVMSFASIGGSKDSLTGACSERMKQ